MQLETRLIGAPDVKSIVAARGLEFVLDQLIDRLRDSLAAFDETSTETVVRQGFRYDKPALGLIEWMPTMEIGRSAAVKTVGYHPSNPVERGLPSVIATTSVYDTSSGHLQAVVEATLLTALRTGAMSALATEALSPDRPITLGVIGTGAQAVSQVHAISRVRTVQRVIAYDHDPRVAATFARRTWFLDRPVEMVQAAALPQLLAQVDVLCTCTTVGIGEGPVLEDGPHVPWLHVNAVGADFPGKLELPESLVRRAFVCPDLRAQCRVEGECQHLGEGEIGPELATVLRHRDRYRDRADTLTVFDSTGWSLTDMVAAELLLEHAVALGLGTMVELQGAGSDPYDPYGDLEHR